MRLFRTRIPGWLLPCVLTLLAGNSWSSPSNAPEALDEGEVTEYLAAPDSAKEEPLPPRPHLHRLVFLNVANLTAAQSHSIPLSLEYEYLTKPNTAWFIGASYAVGAGDGDLEQGLAFGRRWYFHRAHTGPFLGLSPTFAIGPNLGPILLALIASGGYLQMLSSSPWYLSAQGGIGPGVYWLKSPRYDHETGKVETTTGAIVINLSLALGVRF
jgi:hypothetical protein